jgi:hypothetical protein
MPQYTSIRLGLPGRLIIGWRTTATTICENTLTVDPPRPKIARK